MARGRKPQPAAVASQKAAVRSTRKPRAAVVASFSVEGVAAPKTVKGEAAKIWDARAPILLGLKLLSAADVPAFARYCRLTARWETVEALVDKEGLTYESESAHGKLKRIAPAAMLSMRYSRELLALEDRFGMNPAERQRIFQARANRTGDLFEPGQRGAAQPETQDKPAEEPAFSGDEPIGMLQ